jgi:hypothetical protein
MRKNSVAPERQDIPRVGEGKRGEEGYIGYLLRQAGRRTACAWSGHWPTWG